MNDDQRRARRTRGEKQHSAVSALCVVVALVTAAAVVRAQNAAQFENWKEQATPRSAKAACRDLRALTTYDFAIDTATLVPPADGLPEFCLVQGLISPEVRFEVSLPTAWNGRLYMFGNQGFAGEPIAQPTRIQRRNAALKNGFAATQTNAGHDAAKEPLASFAASPQKLIDYAYRAVHVTAATAKQLVRVYYDAPPGHSYFDGCSNGGRQGLMSAQRFPEDFDGIIVGAPLMHLTGTMMQYATVTQALAATPLPPTKIKLVADRVYGKCDAADGFADGLINDPRRCAFDPTKDLPMCAAGTNNATCVTAAEAALLKRVYSDVTSKGAGTTDFFRLFMMPGVFHCGGGVGPDLHDTLTPMVDWVERGKAPDRIVATQKVNDKVARTRPLCPYPMVAKYKGSGSIDEAANFVCAAGDR